MKRAHIAIAALLIGAPAVSSAAPIVREIGGNQDPASILGTVNQFRADLGDPNNLNNPGSLPSGRREINWDGGGNNPNPAPGGTPFDVFLQTRGARFETNGTGFTQATAADLGNPTYTSLFSTFSPLRLFTPLGSNITEGLFFIPGSNGGIPASTRGFGAVFTDVDSDTSTFIQYFDVNDNLLGSFFVPADDIGDGGLSFLGVSFDQGPVVGRVQIVSGNTALGPNEIGAIDLVVMDDFLYGEPQKIPEPGTLILLGAALLGWRVVQRRSGSS
jgi:hypothetical protein